MIHYQFTLEYSFKQDNIKQRIGCQNVQQAKNIVVAFQLFYDLNYDDVKILDNYGCVVAEITDAKLNKVREDIKSAVPKDVLLFAMDKVASLIKVDNDWILA